ncbi:hypothetical protein L3Q82_010895 [Scortum barcoo]|uniref:Uncharacterized protein n=1 Tax=Scortum barcoo TaxID=214431 RepID=A0ACB8W8K7_9TELE|nr:hypothetical protein L3Q82_010895 [Scortum barcoo]
MCSRVFMFLIGAVYICYQVLATEYVYIAELMVESNVTLEAQTVLTVLNTVSAFNVQDSSGSYTVTLNGSELVAECLIVGDETSCNCTSNYTWSNEVCYNYSCCRETTCTANVSFVAPLCISKVKVYISGSVILATNTWSDAMTTQLATGFGKLNGFQNLNITGTRPGTFIDFEAVVSVKFDTSKLQGIVTELEKTFTAPIWVNTKGMVTIEGPEGVVCYKSTPVLKCTFEEKTDSAGWNMSKPYERFELNDGSVVKLNKTCSTLEYQSCVIVTLLNVTGIWEGKYKFQYQLYCEFFYMFPAGIYECGFTIGSVRHTAKHTLNVALLPDVINLMIDPLTADCSNNPDSVPINVTVTILKSIENFTVWWSYMGVQKDYLNSTKIVGVNQIYEFIAAVSCAKIQDAQYVNVTFKNRIQQKKTARMDIPVIYEGAKFCSEHEINQVLWPKTPAGNTVINRTCQEGRVGYNSRTCEGTTWQAVFSYCVSQELNKISNAADNFFMGLGATQKVALDIFEGLKNSSRSNAAASDSIADIGASINVLNVMSKASKNVILGEEVLTDFVDAASSMLNSSWDQVNKSVVYSMSSNYLESVEGLVKNIRVNNSKGLASENLNLTFCSDANCTVSVSDVSVNLNKTTGIMKTVAVKNLMQKLKNAFKSGNTVPSSLLLSATLGDNNDSSLEIMLTFPRTQMNLHKSFCVFWNTTVGDWSEAGCTVKTSDGNTTVCVCNHLTSFAVLMAKDDLANGDLDIITNVGLGVSVCSLLLFLIIESLVWSAVVKTNLSHFRHTALVNIAVFLLLANCSFLASSKPDSLSETWCLVLTICKHLFFLVMFSWMLCMSVMLVHQLIFVFSPLRKRVFMFLSSIVGYVCPILIVGSSYMYCKYTKKKYFDSKTCWLVFDRILEGSIHAFLLPVGTVIFTNLFSMVVVILTLVKSSTPEGGKADDKETAKSILKVVVFLTPVFGVTWIIGFFLLILNENDPMYMIAAYSFTILNSFQVI